MERIILSILLAFGFYQIDWLDNPDYIWILAYIIFGIFYLRQIKKIDALLGIKKTILAKINNVFFHISFVNLLLGIIYGIRGASLGEGDLFNYLAIEYFEFMVFFTPFFLGLQVFLTRRYFKQYKDTNLLTAIYLLYPTYFLNSKNGLSTSTFVESEFKIKKTSLFAVFCTASIVILLICVDIIHLILFYLHSFNHKPVHTETIYKGNRIEHIDHTTGKHCVEYTDNNSGEDCSEFK